MDASNGGVNMNEMNGEPDAGHYHPHTSTRAVHSLNATVVSLHLSSRCMFVAFQKQLDNIVLKEFLMSEIVKTGGY